MLTFQTAGITHADCTAV